MRLTNFFDYSLRVLILLGVRGQKTSIAEISRAYEISNNHVVKVAHNLAKLGYVESSRGKNGGITLARKPREINLGKMIREIEPDFDLVECFNDKRNQCRINAACRLKGIFYQAQKAFLDSLAQYSLEDIIKSKDTLTPLFA